MTTTRKRRGQRPDGYIQVSATVGRDKDGKNIRKYFFGRTRAEAEAKRARFIAELESGLRMDAATMLLSEWVDRWMSTYGINKADYSPYINRLKADLGKHPIREIYELHLRKTLEEAYGGKSTSAATKYRMIIKQVFAKAKVNRIIQHDPADKLDLPKTTTGSHRALERWESELIMANWRVHRAGRWAMIMLLTGLRRGEMVALDWDAINLEKRTLTVSASAKFSGAEVIIKSGAKTIAGQRTLPICDPLYAMLADTPEDIRQGPACTIKGGRRITQAGISRGWKTYCRMLTRVANGEKPDQQGRRNDLKKKADVAPEPKKEKVLFSCTPHDLRHTFATALYTAGVDIKSAQYYLGHADVAMTINLYTHLSVERENQSRSALTDYLDKWLNPEEK